jgi:hypothetical protein
VAGPPPGRTGCWPTGAYSSRTNRAHLRRHGIAATIPVQANHQRHRRRKGSAGGRPPAFDQGLYRLRHAVE